MAMVGDGINDAAALATANLGMAVVSGTDVAMKSADIILVRRDLNVIPDAIALARRTLRTIKGNLVWAFGYNIAAIPLAAFGLLNPLIAGFAMSLSSVFVVTPSRPTPRACARFGVHPPRDRPVDPRGCGPCATRAENSCRGPPGSSTGLAHAPVDHRRDDAQGHDHDGLEHPEPDPRATMAVASTGARPPKTATAMP